VVRGAKGSHEDGFNAHGALREPRHRRRDRPDEGGPIGAPKRRLHCMLLLTTEAVISLMPEKHQNSAASMSGMHGDMY
jgi:hypothetical protein